ncbi:MAG TPA: hypothetical protein VL970_09245 [Candidatus Acidoferrales bacterium]|nr:hypothetical protein [Candidatus Acidoferrales bacterium]
MMPEEQDRVEAAFRQIQPAAPPPALLARLRAAEPAPRGVPDATPQRAGCWARLPALWRGLIFAFPATAALVLIWFAWHPISPSAKVAPPTSAQIKPDAVQVGHSLLASFDTVAQLPGGAPVRFRCREWQDDVVIRDSAHGVEVTQSTPRVEVIPVRFEIY